MVINDILSINDRNAIMAGEEDVMIPFFDLQNIFCYTCSISNTSLIKFTFFKHSLN